MLEQSLSSLSVRTLLIAAVGASLCGLMSVMSPALAQGASAQPETGEEITVRGPYVVHREPVVRSKTGLINPELISVSRAVSYKDIDLSMGPGVAELEKRIKIAADDVCQEIRRRYPLTGNYVWEDTDCVKSATDNAMVVAKQVIAVAGK